MVAAWTKTAPNCSRVEGRRGHLLVFDRAGELLQVCANVDGDAAAARSAVIEAFDVSEIAADGNLHLQVRRFTPAAAEEIRNELGGLDRLLSQY